MNEEQLNRQRIRHLNRQVKRMDSSVGMAKAERDSQAKFRKYMAESKSLKAKRNKTKGSGTRSTTKFHRPSSVGSAAGAGLGGRGGARKLKL
jgi:hypothetical protein